MIKLSICDNAQGLESNLTPQLASEPYTSTKPEKQGKGLGLFMAKNKIFFIIKPRKNFRSR